MGRWGTRAGFVAGLILSTSASAGPAIDAGHESQEVAADAGVTPANAVAPADAATPAAHEVLPAPMEVSARIVAFLDSKKGLLLFGHSGQIYQETGPLQWRREGDGGVSASVLGAFEGADGTIYAVGTRSPLFARTNGLWSASPLVNRGSSAVSLGPTPVISSGRHVYQLQAKGWQRIASTKSRLRALWTANAKRIYVATARNVIAVGGPRSWKSLAAPSFSDGEEVRQIIGLGNGKQVVAITNQNKVLALGASKATALPFTAGLENFDIHTYGVSQGSVILAGQAGVPGARRSVLARVEGGKVRFDMELWPLTEGDRFALLRADGDGLLIVSHQGQVRQMSTAGVWTNGMIEVKVPASVIPTPGQKPARSL